MSLPTQTEMNGIVLVYVADGDIRPRKAIRDELEESLGLTAEERAQTTSSGVRTVQSRAGWSISNLSELGLMECVSYGTWRISDEARQSVLVWDSRPLLYPSSFPKVSSKTETAPVLDSRCFRHPRAAGWL